MISPNVPQSPRAKRKTEAARHLQPQLLHPDVAPDLEDRHHPAPHESGKTTRMHIFINTGQSNVVCAKTVERILHNRLYYLAETRDRLYTD